MDRQTRLLWMNDILDHLTHSYEEWKQCDEQTEQYLADSIKRDLSEFSRLCDAVRSESLAPAVCHA